MSFRAVPSAKISVVFAISTALVGGAIDWTVSLRGAGPLRLGMTLREVQQALRDRTAHLDENTPDGDVDGCSYLISRTLPEKLGLMFQQRHLVRIDVYDKLIRTASGARVGDSEEKIRRLYPGIKVEPHHYVDDGHYLNYWPKNTSAQYGIVFETEGKKVTSFRVGTAAAIALVEGCA